MRKCNEKGFTLLEMLVVIAVIAVLVSIIVPTVTGAATKAKAAADAANLRAVMAEASIDLITGIGSGKKDTSGYVTIENNGGLTSVYATLHNDMKCKSFPDAGLYVSNDGDQITVAFQVYATHKGAKENYYTIEDFARGAAGEELKATGKKVKDPTIDDLFP